jgi:hypothetical protein
MMMRQGVGMSLALHVQQSGQINKQISWAVCGSSTEQLASV